MWTSLSLHVQTWQHHALVVSCCDLSHAMLPNQSWKGLSLTVNQWLSPRLTSSNMGGPQWRAPCPAQRAGALALGGSHGTAPCTQKYTQVHTACWPGSPPLQVTCLTHASVLLTPASMGNMPFYGLGQLGGLQDISALCQGSHSLSCLEGQLRLWIALRASS